MHGTLLEVTAVARRLVADPCSALLDNPHVQLAALGLGSLEVVSFMLELEERLGVKFPAEVIHERTFHSLFSVAECVHALRTTA